MKQTFKKLIKSYNICRLNLRFKSLLIILFSFLQIFCAETDSQVVTCQSEPEYVQSLPSLPGSFHNYPITAKKLDKNVTSVIQNHINKFLIGDDTELSEEFNSALNLKLGLEKGWRVKEYKATSDSKYLIVLATVCDNSNRIPSCLKGRDVISRIYIIDLTKGNILKIIEYLDQICHLALSPTNEYFAVYYDYHVYVYDIQSVLSVNFQEKYKLKIPYDLSNEEDDVFSIREILHLSADGNFIIIHFTQKASFDPDTVIRLANVRIYNIQTGEQLINSGSADEDSIPLNNFEAKFIGKTNIVCVMSDTSIFIYNVQDKKKIFTSSFYNFGYNHQETLNDITNYGYFLKISESSITIYNINEKLEETIELDDKYKKIIIKAKDFFVVLTENDSLILYDFQTNTKHDIEFARVKKALIGNCNDWHQKIVVKKFKNKYLISYYFLQNGEDSDDEDGNFYHRCFVLDSLNKNKTKLMNVFFLEYDVINYMGFENTNYIPMLEVISLNNNEVIIKIYDLSSDKIKLSIPIKGDPCKIKLIDNKLIVYIPDQVLSYDLHTGEKLLNTSEVNIKEPRQKNKNTDVSLNENMFDIFKHDKSILHKLNPYQVKLITWLHTQKSQNKLLYKNSNMSIKLNRQQVDIFMTLPMYVCNALSSNYNMKTS